MRVRAWLYRQSLLRCYLLLAIQIRLDVTKHLSVPPPAVWLLLLTTVEGRLREIFPLESKNFPVDTGGDTSSDGCHRCNLCTTQMYLLLAMALDISYIPTQRRVEPSSIAAISSSNAGGCADLMIITTSLREDSGKDFVLTCMSTTPGEKATYCPICLRSLDCVVHCWLLLLVCSVCAENFHNSVLRDFHSQCKSLSWALITKTLFHTHI